MPPLPDGSSLEHLHVPLSCSPDRFKEGPISHLPLGKLSDPMPTTGRQPTDTATPGAPRAGPDEANLHLSGSRS
ncbi:unnamed protein product [Sphagnum jensenii]